MAWNTPGNLTGLGDMFIYVTDETKGVFPLSMVILIFIISFITVKIGGLETSRSFAFASFITFFLSSIAWVAGILPGNIMAILLAMVVISIIWFYVERD